MLNTQLAHIRCPYASMENSLLVLLFLTLAASGVRIDSFRASGLCVSLLVLHQERKIQSYPPHNHV